MVTLSLILIPGLVNLIDPLLSAPLIVAASVTKRARWVFLAAAGWLAIYEIIVVMAALARHDRSLDPYWPGRVLGAAALIGAVLGLRRLWRHIRVKGKVANSTAPISSASSSGRGR